MEKKIAGRTSLQVLSLVIAIVIWFYVILIKNPDTTETYSNIQINYINTSHLEKQGIIFVGDRPTAVSVTVKGRRNLITGLDAKAISAVADFSSITKSGSYSIPLTVQLPEGLAIIEKKPQNTDVVLDDNVVKKVSVKAIIEGAPKAGINIKEPIIEPDWINITGPSVIVAKVENAGVRLNVSDITASFKQNKGIALYDKNGSEISNKLLKTNTATVKVSGTVDMQKELPIKVITVGNLDSAYKISMETEPNLIKVRGAYDRLEPLLFIETQPVNISGLNATVEKEAQLKLPEGVIQEGGSIDKIKVKLIIEKANNP